MLMLIVESGKKEEVVEEEDKSDDEMTIDTPNSDATESNCTDMAELTPNPDLEWETTAMAEAKKLAEIQSDIPYENPLLMHLYIDCGIVDRVVKAWEENEGEEPKRRGYMGHLTRIANIMVSTYGFLYYLYPYQCPICYKWIDVMSYIVTNSNIMRKIRHCATTS